MQLSVRVGSSGSNFGICLKRERNGISRTQTAALERMIIHNVRHNVRGLRFRRDLVPDRQQMRVNPIIKRASTERQLDIY